VVADEERDEDEATEAEAKGELVAVAQRWHDVGRTMHTRGFSFMLYDLICDIRIRTRGAMIPI
jgi:hypothetical protein